MYFVMQCLPVSLLAVSTVGWVIILFSLMRRFLPDFGRYGLDYLMSWTLSFALGCLTLYGIGTALSLGAKP